MFFQKQALIAGVAAAAFTLSACGGGSSSDPASDGAAPSGQPVSGGTARVIETAEPRSLDPAVVANSWANSPVVGNSLYGTLMIDDPATGKMEYKIAKSFASDDGGSTFTLTLRDGVTFSDGTPFTAEAVKVGWDHVKDPATSSPDIPQAALIAQTTVVDDKTLKVKLTEPIPNFANAIVQTSLNWIASPASIKGGAKVMDVKPIGAGPYTLESWSRQDVIKLVRNDKFWDAPRPYLDRIEVRAVIDPDQRYNTLVSNGADLSLESNWNNLDKAQKAGLQNSTLQLGGGVALVLNTKSAPFDDPRARKALASALDLNTINDAVYNGTGKVPTTLFDQSSPFYQDIPLVTTDAAAAQKLFDELAGEGKPVSFKLSLFAGNAPLGNSIQTQLSTFKNVKVEVGTIDIAQYGTIMAKRDYNVIQSSVTFADPEPRLWGGLAGESRGNYSGINDPELNTALDAGRTGKTEAERVTAYETVQKRLAELNPIIFYTRSAPGVMANKNVGGLQQYGMGSLLPETLWLQK